MKIFPIMTIVLFLIAGCSIKATLPYTPVSTSEINAQFEVENFSYIPPDKKLKPNQVQNTAAGSLYLTDNIDVFFTNDVKRELRQSEISLKPTGQCKMSGKLEQLLIDDLGYSVTYVSDATYTVTGPDNNTIYNSTKSVNFTSSKFVDATVFFANVNKVIADNILQMLNDPNFVKNVEKYCPRQ